MGRGKCCQAAKRVTRENQFRPARARPCREFLEQALHQAKLRFALHRRPPPEAGRPAACPGPRGKTSNRRVPVTGVYDHGRMAVKPSMFCSRGRHGSSGPRGARETDLRFPAANEPGNKAAARAPHVTDPLPDEKGEDRGGSGGTRRIELFLRPAKVLVFSHGSASEGSGAPGSQDATPTIWVPPTSACPLGHLPSCPSPSDRRRDGAR